MSLRTSIGAIGNLLDERPEHCRRVVVPRAGPEPGRARAAARHRPRRASPRSRCRRSTRSPTAPPGWSGRSTSSAARRRGRCGTARRSWSCPTAASTPRTRRSRRCSRWRPCTRTSCARARARCAAWSSSRASRARRCTSRCCSATARRPSPRTWRSRPCPRADRPPLPGRRSAPACSRSARRWASRPSRATAAPRSSRPSGSAPPLVDRYFPGTVSRIGGIELAELHDAAAARHARAFAGAEAGEELELGGEYRYRRGGEHHVWEPGADRAPAAGRPRREPRDVRATTPARSTARRPARDAARAARAVAAGAPPRRSTRSSRRPRSCAGSRPAR